MSEKASVSMFCGCLTLYVLFYNMQLHLARFMGKNIPVKSINVLSTSNLPKNFVLVVGDDYDTLETKRADLFEILFGNSGMLLF